MLAEVHSDEEFAKFIFANNITRFEFGRWYVNDRVLADVRLANEIQRERLDLIERLKRRSMEKGEIKLSRRLARLAAKHARMMAEQQAQDDVALLFSQLLRARNLRHDRLRAD